MSDLKPEFESRANYLNDLSFTMRALETIILMVAGAAISNAVKGNPQKALETLAVGAICSALYIFTRHLYKKDVKGLLEDSQTLREFNQLIKGKEEEVLDALYPSQKERYQEFDKN